MHMTTYVFAMQIKGKVYNTDLNDSVEKDDKKMTSYIKSVLL